jgi:hypothetical protein
MENRLDDLTLEAQVRAIMEELGVDRETAALLAAVRNGVALVDDVVVEPPVGREVSDGQRGRDRTPVSVTSGERPVPRK